MLNSRFLYSRLNWSSLYKTATHICLQHEKQHHMHLIQQTCTFTNRSLSTIKKYTVFNDESSKEIFDVDEERARNEEDEGTTATVEDEEINHEFFGLNLKRGAKHVFDIEDLIEVLHKENAEDVFVCSVPDSMNYVSFFVVCSGRSFRHMISIAEFVRRMYKIKRHKSDIIPRIEGENSREWMAIDLGNIALHIMSAEARETYDLESLWAIGCEYDNEFNKPKDILVELFDHHVMLLAKGEHKAHSDNAVK